MLTTVCADAEQFDFFTLQTKWQSLENVVNYRPVIFNIMDVIP